MHTCYALIMPTCLFKGFDVWLIYHTVLESFCLPADDVILFFMVEYYSQTLFSSFPG